MQASKFQDYWAHIPTCHSDEEVRAANIMMEDDGQIKNDSIAEKSAGTAFIQSDIGGRISLDELMALLMVGVNKGSSEESLQIPQKINNTDVEKRALDAGQGFLINVTYDGDGFSTPSAVDATGKVIAPLPMQEEAIREIKGTGDLDAGVDDPAAGVQDIVKSR